MYRARRGNETLYPYITITHRTMSTQAFCSVTRKAGNSTTERWGEMETLHRVYRHQLLGSITTKSNNANHLCFRKFHGMAHSLPNNDKLDMKRCEKNPQKCVEENVVLQKVCMNSMMSIYYYSL